MKTLTGFAVGTIAAVIGVTATIVPCKAEDEKQVPQETEQEQLENTDGMDLFDTLSALSDILKDPDARTQLAEQLLEGSGLTDEEMEEALTYIHDFTEEDARQFITSFWETVEDGSLFEEIATELDNAFSEIYETELREASEELDTALDELGSALINVTADDIQNFLTELTA